MSDDAVDPSAATIRDATPADLPTLTAIQQAALAEPWAELLETGVQSGPPLALVSCLDDDPIGYALAVPTSDVAYVAEFAIAPPAQNQGLGSRLMDALLDRLRADGFERVRLTVRADDDRARRFYARHGFEERERIADHYETGSGEGLLLSRTL